MHGRGSTLNPTGRFERVAIHEDPEATAAPEGDDETPSPRTEFFRDHSRTALTENDSPDIPFTVSLNPYRGCEHGCAYCYARPTHEYLGFSAGLDFETKILVKEDAPELLRARLRSPSWKPQAIALSGVTDPYQPGEKKLRVTRRCLEILAEARNPVVIITKNRLIARDVDLLGELASHRAAAVYVSLTSLDSDLAGKLEPRASRPKARLEAIAALASAGVPVGVMTAPVIPGLTDHEIPALLDAAAEAGARYAGYTIVRLPYGVKELFSDWLERHFPDRKQKVLSRITDLRGGKLNDPNFGSRMKGAGPWADQIRSLFRLARKRAGFLEGGPELSTAAFRRPGPEGQLPLL